MPLYEFTDPDSGQTIQLQSDAPPSEQQLDALFAQKRNGMPVTASATNAPAAPPQPRWEVPPSSIPSGPPQESTMQYWGRSPIVQDAAQAVGAGARAVGDAAMTGLDVATLPSRATAALGGYALDRAVVQPARAIADAGGRVFDWGAGKAGQAAGAAAGYVNRNVVEPAADWWNRRVRPPTIATPQTKREYDALPRGSYYVDPDDGKTRQKK